MIHFPNLSKPFQNSRFAVRHVETLCHSPKLPKTPVFIGCAASRSPAHVFAPFHFSLDNRQRKMIPLHLNFSIPRSRTERSGRGMEKFRCMGRFSVSRGDRLNDMKTYHFTGGNMVKKFPRSFHAPPPRFSLGLSRVPFQSFPRPALGLSAPISGQRPATREGRQPRRLSRVLAMHLAGRAALALLRVLAAVRRVARPVRVPRSCAVCGRVSPPINRARTSGPASDKAARLRRPCEDVRNRAACPCPITRRALRRRLRR